MGIVILYHFGGIFTGKSFTGINGDFAPCKHLKFKLCSAWKFKENQPIPQYWDKIEVDSFCMHFHDVLCF